MAITNANDHPFKVALADAGDGEMYANSHPYKVVIEGGGIGFEAVIVDELPETGDPKNIYFILKESTPEGDIYDEWMWMLQQDETYGWTHIGTTDTVEIKLYSSTGNHTDGAMTQKAVTQALNTKQNTLTFDNTPTANSTNPVTSQGIKTYVDNNRAFQPYPSSVRTNGTTQQFLNDLVALHADVGTAYLGTVNLSDLPESLTQEEVEAYVYNDYTVWAFLRSADTEPYQWWTCSYDYQGWTPFGKMYSAGTGLNLDNNTNQFSVNTNVIQEKLIAGTNVQIAADGKTISATDTTYTAGNGLNLSGTEFSVDTTAIQEKLTAGTEIDITNNTISATNTGKARVLTSADYNWPTNNPDGIAQWLLPDGTYVVESNQAVVYPDTGSSKQNIFTFIKVTEGQNAVVYYIGLNEHRWLYWSANKTTGARNSYGAVTPAVIDNVTDTSATKALSANMGKYLKDLIDAIPAYADFIGTDGTTPGTHGLVPAPTTADGDKYLKGDGTWAVVSQPHTLTDAEYEALWSQSNPLNDILESIVSGAGV